MARQQGILKFKGNIGSFSMYKTQDGFQGREKSGIEPGRIWDILAGMVILTTLGLLTISGQTVRIATTNPAETLKVD